MARTNGSDRDMVRKGGPVMGFQFARQQMVESAAYELSRSFPKVLSSHPALGTRVLVGALRRSRSPWARGKGTVAAVQIGTHRGSFADDGRTVWDYRYAALAEPEIMMLDAWEKRLLEVAEAGGPELDAFVSALCADGTTGALWRRSLHSMAQHPDSVGAALHELLSQPSVLGARATRKEAGDALQRIFGRLDQTERARIEGAVLSLAERARDRLLGCHLGSRFRPERNASGEV
jgi:hypothetical protein